jgi:hypothetical protein
MEILPEPVNVTMYVVVGGITALNCDTPPTTLVVKD